MTFRTAMLTAVLALALLVAFVIWSLRPAGWVL